VLMGLFIAHDLSVKSCHAMHTGKTSDVGSKSKPRFAKIRFFCAWVRSKCGARPTYRVDSFQTSGVPCGHPSRRPAAPPNYAQVASMGRQDERQMTSLTYDCDPESGLTVDTKTETKSRRCSIMNISKVVLAGSVVVYLVVCGSLFASVLKPTDSDNVLYEKLYEAEKHEFMAGYKLCDDKSATDGVIDCCSIDHNTEFNCARLTVKTGEITQASSRLNFTDCELGIPYDKTCDYSTGTMLCSQASILKEGPAKRLDNRFDGALYKNMIANQDIYLGALWTHNITVPMAGLFGVHFNRLRSMMKITEPIAVEFIGYVKNSNLNDGNFNEGNLIGLGILEPRDTIVLSPAVEWVMSHEIAHAMPHGGPADDGNEELRADLYGSVAHAMLKVDSVDTVIDAAHNVLNETGRFKDVSYSCTLNPSLCHADDVTRRCSIKKVLEEFRAFWRYISRNG